MRPFNHMVQKRNIIERLAIQINKAKLEVSKRLRIPPVLTQQFNILLKWQIVVADNNAIYSFRAWHKFTLLESRIGPRIATCFALHGKSKTDFYGFAEMVWGFSDSPVS